MGDKLGRLFYFVQIWGVIFLGIFEKEIPLGISTKKQFFCVKIMGITPFFCGFALQHLVFNEFSGGFFFKHALIMK